MQSKKSRGTGASRAAQPAPDTRAASQVEDAERALRLIPIKGRGATYNPPNRFESIEIVPDADSFDPEELEAFRQTTYYNDNTRTLLTRNSSPDVGFEYSLNPYKGCSHGCVYCYARQYHEFLGLSSGLDFETKIFVKRDAPALLRRELSSSRWTPQVIALSGATDPYQPIERTLRITRGCLEVFAEFRNPVGIITKNHLITRDVDLLSELATFDGVGVSVSITSLRNEIQRVMEPRTSIPAKRLSAVETLAKAGVPVNVMVAPIVPGLTDEETPAILRAAADAGARSAGYIVVRLPHAVKSLFEHWLTAHFPDRREKVLNRIRSMREGRLYESKWGVRMRGDGLFADQIEALFDATCRKLGLNGERRRLSTEHFRRVSDPSGQLTLL